ncbi:MAG TPA: DUF484 family protein [Caulobacteraceae bacterium]|nr:DUF484 family protein [Caulobacteraceae bacterium]
MDQGTTAAPIEVADLGEEAFEVVKAVLRARPEIVTTDHDLMQSLGVRPTAPNVVEFGPVALSRVSAAHRRESTERRKLEAIARANFAAQAQTHAAVVDLLDARNHSDLARRVDELARLRFGLVAGAVALEGPGRTPAGWRPLVEGQIDLIFGPRNMALMGQAPTALGLFGERAADVASLALVRLAIWEPARQGVIAFGSADEKAFTADMGADLVAFLARVVERTAERWPVL